MTSPCHAEGWGVVASTAGRTSRLDRPRAVWSTLAVMVMRSKTRIVEGNRWTRLGPMVLLLVSSITGGQYLLKITGGLLAAGEMAAHPRIGESDACMQPACPDGW